MTEINYTHWQDYYKETFLKELETTESLRTDYLQGKCETETIYNQIKNLFNTSCKLLCYYLSNNGAFHFKNLKILRHSFYIDFLDNPDVWINLLFLFEDSNNKNQIKEFCEDDKFAAFRELSDKFQEMINAGK